jgi:ribose 5-phosphate isomerase RpiB
MSITEIVHHVKNVAKLLGIMICWYGFGSSQGHVLGTILAFAWRNSVNHEKHNSG